MSQLHSQLYDAIIIGGGHNGLVTAACLAKAGERVLVLEKRDVLGGAAATEAIFPGFKVNTGANDAGLFQDEIIEALSLEAHGLQFLESPVTIFAPQSEGKALTLWRDEEKCVAEIGHFSTADAERFPVFKQQLNDMAQVLQSALVLTPPDIQSRNMSELLKWGNVGLQLKRLGNQAMMEFLRVLPMSVDAYLNEWFESDFLKGVLGSMGIIGNQLGPRAAGTTFMLFYQNAQGFQRSRFVAGGVGQLSTALATAAQYHGAEIRIGEAAVSHILLEDAGGRSAIKAKGVVLSTGETIAARRVISSLDPRRTFFELVGPQNLEPHFMRQVRNVIYRGCTAKMHLALRALPQFKGQISEVQLGGHILISPTLDYLEQASDAAKYGAFSDKPYLDIVMPTVLDPTLAPDGQHIMSITMQYAPYQLRTGDWHTHRKALDDTIIDTLTTYVPNLRELILHQHLLTPLDLEDVYGLTEGSIYHGQMGLDQLLIMRPVPGWSRYQTPIDNLYLCGAGTHPGGGVTGMPGYNAAREVLKKWG